MARVPAPPAPPRKATGSNVTIYLPFATITAADKMAATNGWSRSYTIAELLRRSLADAPGYSRRPAGK